MITLSVTLPDFAALAWQALSRHLPDIQRARMGAYTMNIAPSPQGVIYAVECDLAPVMDRPIVVARGCVPSPDQARHLAYEAAIDHARRIVAHLGGNP